MKWLIDKIPQSQAARWWHGVVYFDWVKNRTITMLMPFNLIARFVLCIYHTIRMPKELWWERNERLKFIKKGQ